MFSARKGSGRVGPLSRSIHFLSALCASLLLLQLLIFGQIDTVSDQKLVSSLVASSNNPSEIDRLIDENASAIDEHLWKQLISAATNEYYSDSGKAIRIYQIAIKVGRKLNDKRLLATTYYDLGLTYSGLAQFDKSIEAYLQCKGYFEEAGLERDLIYVLSDLGTLYLAKEDYQRAADYSKQSISLAGKLKGSSLPPGAWPDEYGVAGSLSTLGVINQFEGDYDKAIADLKQSLSIYLDLKKRSIDCDFYIADVLSGLGRVNNLVGDNNQALIYFNQALELGQTLRTKPVVASTQNSLGMLYLEQEDYQKATDFFTSALKLYQGDNNEYESARVLLNIAVTNQRQRFYDEALKSFNSIVGKEKPLEYGDLVIAAYEGIGTVNIERGNASAARVALDRGLQLAIEKHNQLRIAEILWRQATAYFSAADYPKSAELAEKAISIANQYRLNKISYLALTTLGRARLKQGQIELAKQNFSEAMKTIEQTRQQVAGAEQQSETFFEHALEPYTAMTELLISQKDFNSALVYAEMAKGRVLVDVFSRRNVRISKAMTSDEKEQESNLNSQIARLNNSLREESLKPSSDPKRLSELHLDLDSARKRYDTFLNLLYASHPELKTLRAQALKFNITSLSDSIEDDNTVFLEYFVAADRVYLFTVSKRLGTKTPDVNNYLLNGTKDEIFKKVEEFRSVIANRKTVYADLSRELYDLLIRPASNQLLRKKRICIVPDGLLWDLPFQALQSDDNRFLIEDLAIYYAPSITLLGQMTKTRTRSNPIPKLIALGNPAIHSDNREQTKAASGDQSLPEAESEVRALETIFGPQWIKVLTGAAASETSFKTLAPNYGLIHIASHGIVDNTNPLYSYLLLSKSDDTNDGFLEAREIMNMDLQADLAVLSACETARGRVGAGEGVIGLSWSFFIAGCQTTVVSQWKVNSVSTSELMVRFYRNLKFENGSATSEKADALRNAALGTMKDPRFGHPFYWAAFVMVGSNQ